MREGEVIRAEETRLQLACNCASCTLEVDDEVEGDIENRSGNCLVDERDCATFILLRYISDHQGEPLMKYARRSRHLRPRPTRSQVHQEINRARS